MRKITLIVVTLLINTFVSSAQKLIITEVDAAENNYFNKTSVTILGEKMDLDFSGETLSVKIANEPKLVLKKYSENLFETERQTANGIEKISMQIETVNSVVTSAELTATLIPIEEQQKKLWWAVTAKSSDAIPININ